MRGLRCASYLGIAGTERRWVGWDHIRLDGFCVVFFIEHGSLFSTSHSSSTYTRRRHHQLDSTPSRTVLYPSLIPFHGTHFCTLKTPLAATIADWVWNGRKEGRKPYKSDGGSEEWIYVRERRGGGATIASFGRVEDFVVGRLGKRERGRAVDWRDVRKLRAVE